MGAYHNNLGDYQKPPGEELRFSLPHSPPWAPITAISATIQSRRTKHCIYNTKHYRLSQSTSQTNLETTADKSMLSKDRGYHIKTLPIHLTDEPEDTGG
jgi:hypothetical protein